jgi:hypothetical protein
MNRFQIAMFTIATLVLAARHPALGAPTGAEKCAASKISATGKYSLCRMQAESRAEQTGEQVDFGNCAENHTRAFQKTEAKHGAECPTSGDAAAIQIAVREQTTRLACLLKGLSDGSAQAGAAIVSVRGIEVTPTIDPTLTVANVSNAPLTAYCFFADDSVCHTADFFVTVPAQSSVSWLASVGIQSQIVPTTVPFSGEMVCLQVDAPDLSPVPLFGSNLSASMTPPGGCPQDGIGIAAGSGNNGDPILTLGGVGNEYGPCPAGIGAARIESCWSNSAFTFECHDPSAAIP